MLNTGQANLARPKFSTHFSNSKFNVDFSQSFYEKRFFEFRRVPSVNVEKFDRIFIEINPGIPDRIDYGRPGSHPRSKTLIIIEAMLRVIAQIL